MKRVLIVCMLLIGTSAAHAGYKNCWSFPEGDGYRDYKNFGQYVASHHRANGYLKKVVDHLKKGDFDLDRPVRVLHKLAYKYHRKVASLRHHRYEKHDKRAKVPEPGPLALMGLGLVALVIARRRRGDPST